MLDHDDLIELAYQRVFLAKKGKVKTEHEREKRKTIYMEKSRRSNYQQFHQIVNQLYSRSPPAAVKLLSLTCLSLAWCNSQVY